MENSIIVTGASSGIGRAAAEKFLDAGWQVGLLARRQEKLETLAKGRDNAHILVADVTDNDALTVVFSKFVGSVGRLDVLFNNAGMFGPTGSIDEIDPQEWLQIVNLNISGMFYSARLAFGQMRRQSPQGGRIINNGSISAISPRAGSICYTTTKHAISGLTKSLALDGRGFDIACGQIDIGNARTAMIEGLEKRALADDPNAQLQPTMDMEHAVSAVFHMAELPLSANVQSMTIIATKMPFVGRG
ncbi:MAG: SDR family oxidoreductase [Paracoccaceae bacterium]